MPILDPSEGKEEQPATCRADKERGECKKIDREEADVDCKGYCDGNNGEEETGVVGRERSAAFREAPIVERVLEYLLSEGLEDEFERFAG